MDDERKASEAKEAIQSSDWQMANALLAAAAASGKDIHLHFQNIHNNGPGAQTIYQLCSGVSDGRGGGGSRGGGSDGRVGVRRVRRGERGGVRAAGGHLVAAAELPPPGR